jgi:serine/threonine-protein kinase
MGLPERIGRYEILDLLGQGGMGRVLLARDSVLGREVAVKILRADLGLPPEVKRALFDRMRNEAKAAAALTHRNIVTLHDMGEDDEVGLYLVFEYVRGITLRDRLADGPMPPVEVARMAIELGSALSHAHLHGVIHRDVKPENVILSSNGTILTDFGIARIPDSTMTTAGTVFGTPAYSAPEALASATFTAASDQFALAVTLYEALSAKRAFPGEDALAVALRVQNEEPTPLADGTEDPRLKLLFGRVDGVLRRALAKKPEDRYSSARAFGDAFAAAIDTRVSGAITIPPMRSASIVPRETRRWQNMFVGLAILVIVGLVVFGRRARDEAAKAKADESAAASAPPHAAPQPTRSKPKPSAAPSTGPASASAPPELPPLPPP